MNRAVTRKQIVLRDFSELRPLEARIALVAVGISQIGFKGVANDDFRPAAGTQVERQWKMKKLDERQQVAWQTFVDDVKLSHGKSGTMSIAYRECIDTATGDTFREPVAYVNSYQRRLERLLLQYLDRKECALIVELLQDTLRANGSLQIETIGFVRSGYGDKVSARAAGVAHVQCLLDRLATFYGI